MGRIREIRGIKENEVKIRLLEQEVGLKQVRPKEKKLQKRRQK